MNRKNKYSQSTMENTNLAEIQKDASNKQKAKENKEKITIERYRISVEKLQLSWLRKSIMISFLGLSIYKIFEAETNCGKGRIMGYISAREIGLCMLLVGFVSLVMATKQHLKTLEKLKIQYEEYDVLPKSMSLKVSYIILLITLFLFLATLAHYGTQLFTGN